MSYGLNIADQVAKTSIDLYSSLRHHGKPTIRPNGVEEWTILATISLVFPSHPTASPYSYPPSSSESVNFIPENDKPDPIRVIPVSLGTGVKVLPANRLPPLGDAVHDSHAEVLARRGFVRWLIEEGRKAVEYEITASSTTSGTGMSTGDSGESSDTRRRRWRRRRNRKAGGSSSDHTPEVRTRALPEEEEEDKAGVQETIADTAEMATPKEAVEAREAVGPKNAVGPKEAVETSKKNTIQPEEGVSPRMVPGSLGWKNDSSADSDGKKKRRRKKKSGKKTESSSEASPWISDVALPAVEPLKIDEFPDTPTNDEGLVNAPRNREKRKSVTFDLGDVEDLPNLENATNLAMDSALSVDSSAESSSETKRKNRRASKKGKGKLALKAQDAIEPSNEKVPAKLSRSARKNRKANPSKVKEEIHVIWQDGKVALKEGVEIWLYVSALPCGDASMLHTAAHQDPEIANARAASPPPTPNCDLPPTDDTSPIEKGSPITPTAPTLSHAVRGRNGYDNFGAIRTKPGRADSTPTISLSCSDKMASWAVLGLQGALLEELFEPAYLSGVVISGVESEKPEGWISRPDKTWRQVIVKEVERALWGRLGPLIGRLPSPFDLHPPAIFLTDVEFLHSKGSVAATSKTDLEPAPSTLSLTYVPALMKKGPEVLYNGTRQSSTWKPPGTELLKPKARATVCKIETMWAYIHLVEAVMSGNLKDMTLPDSEISYHDLKHRFESPYQRAKTLIRGLPTTADTLHSAFGTIGPFDITFTPDSEFSKAIPPFSGWIVSGKRFESFNKDAELLLPPELWPTVPPPPPPVVKAKKEVEQVGIEVSTALGMNMAAPLTPPPEALGLDVGPVPDGAFDLNPPFSSNTYENETGGTRQGF